jgi:zinc and cadmium transporter
MNLGIVWFYTLASVLVGSLVSLAGVFTLGINEQKLRSVLSYLISFSAGALLGDVFLHVFPEMAEISFGVREGLYFLIGIVVFFVLERLILWHHAHGNHEEKVHSMVYLTMFGDSLHNFIDGLVIAASFLISPQLGLASAIAVIFHEIPQEIGQFAILLHGGWSKRKALWYNFLSALTAVAGAVIVLVFAKTLVVAPSILLAVAGSSFIYIAMSDLIPELHQEVTLRRSLVQFVWFALGIGVMGALLVVG